MSKPIRVRFAPSPTGHLHVGGLRSALFNYLFVSHHDGIMILRIEDTDQLRLVEGSMDQIQDSLKWLGIEWQEGVGRGGEHGPYIQSERLKLYAEHANSLVEQGRAYRDYTSPADLDRLRKTAQVEKRAFRFSKDLAKLDPDTTGQPYVIRFEIKAGDDVIWDDAVWGEQSWKREVLDDFVAIKSDGYPTYNFAVVVDDYLMEISHVLRGQEFLSTTPKNVLVYEALGWDVPKFAHLPPVLGADKSKLSKRHGARSALEYRDQGYLPEAVFNYLASLGFNDGTTKEIYTPDELSQAFDLGRIQSSPAVFDPDRLDWMNGQYIRQLSNQSLLEKSKAFWPQSSKRSDSDYISKVLDLVKDRLKFFAEIPELVSFFFEDPQVDKAKFATDQGLLIKIISTLETSDFDEASLETALRQLVAVEGLKAGQLFGLIRVAITGKTAAPGLFETLSVLGKDVSLRRLRAVT